MTALFVTCCKACGRRLVFPFPPRRSKRCEKCMTPLVDRRQIRTDDRAWRGRLERLGINPE